MWPQGLYNMIGGDSTKRLDNMIFNERATFEYRYCLWPRRCYNTGRWLWLETAVRGCRVITGPGTPIVVNRWYDSNEALVIMLKKVSE